MKPKMKFKAKAAVVKSTCFKNHVNKIIHTLYQSKYFTSWVLMSQ